MSSKTGLNNLWNSLREKRCRSVMVSLLIPPDHFVPNFKALSTRERPSLLATGQGTKHSSFDLSAATRSKPSKTSRQAKICSLTVLTACTSKEDKQRSSTLYTFPRNVLPSTKREMITTGAVAR